MGSKSNGKKGRSGDPRVAAEQEAKDKAIRTIPVATKDHLQKRPRATGALKIILDEDLASKVEEAELALQQAIALEAVPSVINERTAALRKAREDAVEATVQIKLKAIGRKRWKDLEDEHPPLPETDAEHRAATKDPDNPHDEGQPAPFEPSTFAPAVIAETVVEPRLTPEEWGELTEDWSDTEFEILWINVAGVNKKSRVQHWGKG